MVDDRIKKLAHNLVNYSVSLKEGESVLIDLKGIEKEVYKVGGHPFVKNFR